MDTVGLILAIAALGVAAAALYFGAQSAGDADDLLIAPPLDQTQGVTTSQRAEAYGTAQGFDVLAMLAAFALGVGAALVALIAGAGPVTWLALAATVATVFVAAYQRSNHATLAVGAEQHRADLAKDGALETYPVIAQ